MRVAGLFFIFFDFCVDIVTTICNNANCQGAMVVPGEQKTQTRKDQDKMNTTEIIPAWAEMNVCETTRRLVDELCENCDSADQYITDNAISWSLETLVDMLIGYDAQESERRWEEDHGGPADFHRVGAGDNTMICRERPDGLPDTNDYYEIHTGTYWRGNAAVNAEGEIVEQL